MTGTEQLAVFKPDDAREIKRRVLGATRWIDAVRVHGADNADCYYAIAQESFVAATNPLTGYTTVSIQVLKYSGTGLDMEEVTGDSNLETAVIRSRNCFGSLGTLLIVKRIMSEWAVIWVDCPEIDPSSTASSVVTPSIASSEAPPPP